MKQPQLNSLYKMTKFSLLICLGLSSGLVTAGPLNISNGALEIADGVEPNVMILNDDSGSMDWTILAADDQGTYNIQNTLVDTINVFSGGVNAAYNINAPYLYIFNDGDNSDTNGVFAAPFPAGGIPAGLPNFYTLPTENALNNFNANVLDLNAAGYNNWQGVWRVRNSNYNTTYYNPNVLYEPWAGADDSGASYTNSPVNAARVDPYRVGGGTTDLTVASNLDTYLYRNTVVNFVNQLSFFYALPDNIFPASYYIWSDTDGDSVVDANDAHTLVQIRVGGACTNGAICPSSFLRPGNRTDCGGNNDPQTTVSCTSAQELQNFANWYSYYRRRELTAKGAITKVLEKETAIRVGMATINNIANNRIQVQSLNISPFSGNKNTLFDRIFSTQSAGRTPLRRNLEATGNYFACNNNNIFGTGSSNPGNTNCPVQASPAGECQQNYTILMTDGFWNGNDPTIHNADGDGQDGGTPKGPFDGGSFADNTGHTLADVAMHFYERDLHGSLQDEVPTTKRDRNRYIGVAPLPFENMHQHMSTYTIGFGVAGTRNANPDNVTSNPAQFNAGTITGWPDPTNGNAEKIDDLRHAAWNARGDFLSAANQTSLTQSLTNIFDEIQSGKGSASAVAFNSQDLQADSRIFRATFDTTLNTGNLIAQSISITGVIDTSNSLWGATPDAGAALKLDAVTGTTIDSNNRVIATYDDSNSTGIPFRWASLNANQKTLLGLPTITSNPPTLGEDRLEYLRGQIKDEGDNTQAGEFRTRPVVAGKLGDIIHSAPVFVGAPPFFGRDQAPYPVATGKLYSEFMASRAGREEAVYIGANDGMLHAFKAASDALEGGKEIFAFIPNSVFSLLSELTDSDYNHRYFVDMTPAINDVFITPTSGTNINTPSWNTVLVGGLGIAGAGYFALNVTDPNSLNDEDNIASNVMWEFEQSDDIGGVATNSLNLGGHVREPLIVMSNVDGAGSQKRWVAIFGNGYNSASASGNAELYILFLDGGLDGTWAYGSDFIKIDTGVGKAQSSDGTTPNGLGAVQAIDTDGNGTADVVYAGDYQGNVYRFNISSTTVAGLTNASNKPVQKLFTATYNGGTATQPITNRPAVIKHPQLDGYIVVVGTGSYFTVEDTTSTDIQSIYGLWDDFIDPSDSIVAINYNKLQEQMFSGTPSVISGITVDALSDVPIDFGTGAAQKQGWVIDLDATSGGSVEFPGERAVRNFLLRGNFVFVNTVIPKSGSACTTGPGSFTLGFNPVTGGSGSDAVFDINNDGVFDSDDNISGVDNAANVVSRIRSDKATLTDSSTIGNRLVSQGSDQSITSIPININTQGGKALGRHSWREIEP